MDRLRIGTCSWKYPSWEGLVYSRAEGIDFLEEYSNKFSTVEIDQWFWTLPDRVTAAQYASVVPPDFSFTVKVPQAVTLTHLRPRGGEESGRENPDFLSPRKFAEILERLEPLAQRIGVLMLQFEYLNRKKMPSEGAFLERLEAFAASVPRSVPLGVEIRNPNWLDAAYFGFLKRNRLVPVFLQGYYMPQVTAVYAKVRGLVEGTVVIRLHGTDRGGMEERTGQRWDRIAAPRDAELDGIRAMVDDLLVRGAAVYLNVNNHYEGSAPLTIGKLRAIGLRG